MFDSYDEADDLRTNCVRCGKSKFTVIGIYGEGTTKYDLERCTDQNCTSHCHGHSEPFVIDNISYSEDHRAMTSIFNQ